MAKSWKDIVRCHLVGPMPDTFTRHPNVELSYKRHRQEHQQLGPYIMRKYLRDHLRWTISDNAFPYHLDRNISHKILWINPAASLTAEEVKSIIHRYMQTMPYRDYIYFQNPMVAKSIPEIPHYHILINK